MADPEVTGEDGSGDTSPTPSRLSPNETLGHYISLWKTSVEVQQHFNDIEWRIRGLALTVATFALGAAGVAAKDGSTLGPISLGSAVLVLGLILWYAFYFVDRIWYHPLLKAAVAEGTQLEQAIGRYLPGAHMTEGITERSPQSVGPVVAFLAGPIGTERVNGVAVMHSDHKLRWFYRVGAFTFIIGAIALQIGVWITGHPDGQPIPAPAPSATYTLMPEPIRTGMPTSTPESPSPAATP